MSKANKISKIKFYVTFSFTFEQVKPLLQVTKQEEKLNEKEDELRQVKEKMDKVEQEVTDLEKKLQQVTKKVEYNNQCSSIKKNKFVFFFPSYP